MGTAVVATFDDRPQRSAALAAKLAEKSNIKTMDSVPSLSPGGKKWTIVKDGEKTVLTKNDADGDPVPVGTFKVIVLDQAASRGRAYYATTYDPDKPAMPDCWSDDMIAPNKSVNEPCAVNCANCPKAAKDSKKYDNGKTGTACQAYKMLAVVPAADPKFTPLRLKLAITSIYDSQNAKNDAALWFAFDNYCKWLKGNGVQHTAEVITKMKFDEDEDYPKILFFKDAWTPNEVLDELLPVIEGPEVRDLITARWTPNGTDGKRTAIAGPKDGLDARAETAKNITPKGPTAEEIAAAAEAKHIADELAAKAAAKAKRIADAAAALAAAQAEDDDDNPALPGTETAKLTPPAASAKAGAKKDAPKAAAAAAAGKAVTEPAAGDATSKLKGLMSAWGDD